MPEMLVDVADGNRLLHVFLVRIDSVAADVAAFERKALESAAHARLVPYAELGRLEAHVHVDHSGSLEPCDDPLGVKAETREGLEQYVRERAYFLWKDAGEQEPSHG